MESICDIVREVEDNYVHGNTHTSEYVDYDMHAIVNRIDAYINSRHISGSADSLGREKPFFNIITAVVNVWYRATDLDRKNVRFKPRSRDQVLQAFIMSVLLQEWMRKSRFGMFLNEWGRTLAKYGSAVVKFVERKGELIATVIPWSRFIPDPIDFDAVPRIEKFYMTPVQLRKQTAYDQEVVEKLIASAQTTRKDLEGDQKDQRGGFIEIYEVHGELPVALLKDEPEESDWKKDAQQMHVVSFVQEEGGEYSDFTLYRGREARDPYMITHLIPEDNRTLSIGAVEYLFDAQWMMNHTMKNMKDTLDLASRLIFQTADTNYAGRNVLRAVEVGDIMIHADNRPMTQVNTAKPDVTALISFGTQWLNISRDISSTPEALRGETLPAGTPYSLGAYLGGQASSLFDIMTENKGQYVEEMARRFIIPHLKNKMDTKDEVLAVLDQHQITEIDALYVPKEAIKRYNDQSKQMLMDGIVPSPYNPTQAEAEVRRQLSVMGNQRSFKPDDLDEKTWRDRIDELDDVIVEVTNEESDKQAVLTTLATVFQTIAGNPNILRDPNGKMLFSAILTETGKISPVQIAAPEAQTSQPQVEQAPNLQPLAESGAITRT